MKSFVFEKFYFLVEIYRFLKKLFENFPWSKIWLGIKIVFVVFDFLLIMLFIYVVFRYKKTFKGIKIPRLKKFEKKSNFIQEEIKERWLKVLENLNKKNQDALKLAIIEADALLDKVLENLGYKGENLFERLVRLANENYPHIDKIWEAHRLRNKIVHQSGFELSFEKTKETIKVYEDFFKSLNIL